MSSRQAPPASWLIFHPHLGDTCPRTQQEVHPFYMITLDRPIDVYAVSVKTPTPLDPKATYADGVEKEEWDGVLWQTVTNIPPGIEVQKITTYGPWPWCVHKHKNCHGSFSILNRHMEDREQSFYQDRDYSHIGPQPESVCRIEHFGTLEVVDGDCVDNNGILREHCAYFYVVEGDLPETYYIKKLQPPFTDYGFVPEQVASGASLILSSTPTAYYIYDSKSGRRADIWSLLHGQAYLSPTTSEGTLAIRQQGEYLVLDAHKTTLFRLRHAINSGSPRYQYEWTLLTSEAGISPPGNPVTDFLSFTGSHVCMEVVGGGTGLGFGFGGVVMKADRDDREYLIHGFRSSIYPLQTAKLLGVVSRISDPGLKNFRIGVSDHYSPGDDVSQWAMFTCHIERAAPPSGQHVTYTCDAMLHGKYIVVYIDDSQPRSLQLCDVDVHYLLGPGHGDPCLTDDDCTHPDMWCMEDTHNVLSCQCRPGWSLYHPGTACVDVDECALTGSVCEGVSAVAGYCENTAGSYVCRCPDGYQWDTLNGCQDIDETQYGNCGCEQMCLNRVVHIHGVPYQCSCNHGYQLTDNDHSCVDLDECFLNHCTELSAVLISACNDYKICTLPSGCNNYLGGYECLCPAGYQYDGQFCIDIDECSRSAFPGYQSGCEDQCTNLIPEVDGLRYQCSCDGRLGYTLSPADQHSCIDLDECETGIHHCYYGSKHPYNALHSLDQQALCRNTIGGFQCVCAPGYRWMEEEYYCRDINECLPYPCHHECENTYGSYYCSCHHGYHLASNNQDCVPQIGGECGDMCVRGLVGPGRIHGTCNRQDEMLTCSCPKGYTWDHMEGVCMDVNECIVYTPCQDVCYNRRIDEDGVAYQCGCSHTSMVLAADLHTCTHFFIGGGCDGSTNCQVRFTLCLDTPWNPVLLKMEDGKTEYTIVGIEVAVKEMLIEELEVEAQLSDFHIASFFDCGGLGFELVFDYETPILDMGRQVVAKMLAQALEEHDNTLIIHSVKVELVDAPRLLLGDGPIQPPTDGGPLPQPPTSDPDICAYYDHIQACQHGGFCVLMRGNPVCSCPYDYSGIHCEIKNPNAVADDLLEPIHHPVEFPIPALGLPGLGMMEMVYIVGGVVGLGLVVLAVVVALLCYRRSTKPPTVDSSLLSPGSAVATIGAGSPATQSTPYLEQLKY